MSFTSEDRMDNIRYHINSERKNRENDMLKAGWTTLEHLQSLTSAARSLLHARWVVEKGESK